MGFFNNLLNHPQAEVACALSETHAVVRQIVSVLGFDIVSSPDYASRLVPALNAAVEYLDGQIASISGPYDISAAHYAYSPLANELFPSRQEITHGFGRSREVKQPLAFLVGAEQKQAFALLGARRWPAQSHPGEAPTFCDHTLRALAASEAGARQGLRTAVLTSMVTEFGEHLEKLRQKGSPPRAEGSTENRGAPPLTDVELQPENLLRGLIAWLQRSSEFFQVRPGESTKDSGGSPVHQTDVLSKLSSRDRRCWTVCIVSFPTAEGMAAVQHEAHPHRYIVI